MSSHSVAAARSAQTAAGIALMVLAMALVPMIDVQAKYLVTGGIVALQVVFLRLLWGTILLSPLVMTTARDALVPAQGWFNALLLGVFSITGGMCFFGALEYLPIADTVAISFVQPLFVTIFSRLFLKEAVGWLRWVAVAIGFGASLLIIRPDFEQWDIGSLLALGSGVSMAVYAILLKKSMTGARSVTALALTFHTHFSGLVVGLPLVFFVWQPLTLAQWGLALGMAVFGLIGHYLIIRAYEKADASIIAPFAYTEIITSTGVSWLFFADMPDLLTFIGVGILVASSLMIYWHR